MNRFGITKISSVTLLTIGFAFAGFSTPSPLVASTVEECSKELLLSFFPEAFVKEVLQKNGIAQDKWEPIVKGLKEKNDDVIKLVDEQASKMTPNPLKDPSQKQVAVKIFRESLYQVFSGVLKANGISDDQKINLMLGEIQQLKTKRFAQCMESNKASSSEGSVSENEKQPKIDQTKKDGADKKEAMKGDKNPKDDEDDDEDDELDDGDEDEEAPEEHGADQKKASPHAGSIAMNDEDVDDDMTDEEVEN